MNSPTNKISIITPTLNNANGLWQTLTSIKAQTTAPFEHIIVDGNSDDDTIAVCRKYAEGVTYSVKIIRAAPGGMYDAVNRGLKEVSGDIVGLLHPCDIFASEAVLQRIHDAFDSDEELDMAYSDIVYIKASGASGRYYSGRPFRPGLLKWGYMFPHPSMYVRKHLFDTVGIYSTQYKVAGDFEWLVRVLLNNNKYKAQIFADVCR
ncbi:MAG: glycosyltransferase [Ruminococcus sp.]|nr:glycosyltransferase [Ruminococcus sp.]